MIKNILFRLRWRWWRYGLIPTIRKHLYIKPYPAYNPPSLPTGHILNTDNKKLREYCNKLFVGQEKFKGNREQLDLIKKIAYTEPGEERLTYVNEWNNLAMGDHYYEDIDLQGAYLADSNLSGLYLAGANFEGSNLHYAKFVGANLASVNFSNSDLEGGRFDDAAIYGANLNGASLREAKNFILNDNSIEKTKFSPESKDPYSVLRRKYTGFRFTIIMVLTTLALIPHLFNFLILLGASGAEIQANKMQVKFDKTLSKIQKEAPFTNEQLSNLKEYGKSINPYNSKDYKKSRIIYELLEREKGLTHLILTIIIVFYNVGRGILTLKINRLREEETRSKQIPDEKHYLHFYKYHKILSYLFIITFVAGIYKTWLLLWLPIYIPIR